MTAKGTQLAKIISDSYLQVPFTFPLMCQVNGQQEGSAQINTQWPTSFPCSAAYWAVLCTRCGASEEKEALSLPARRLCSNRGKQTCKQLNLMRGKAPQLAKQREKWLNTNEWWFQKSLPD